VKSNPGNSFSLNLKPFILLHFVTFKLTTLQTKPKLKTNGDCGTIFDIELVPVDTIIYILTFVLQQKPETD
jgi:hypothetical protein